MMSADPSPLFVQEFVRLVKSARVTMADRSVALAALQAARGEVEGRRSKLMKLRGTPGIRVGRRSTSSCTEPLDCDGGPDGGLDHRQGPVVVQYMAQRSVAIYGSYAICCTSFSVMCHGL